MLQEILQQMRSCSCIRSTMGVPRVRGPHGQVFVRGVGRPSLLGTRESTNLERGGE